ncbi:MAG: hypothetical protein MK108_15630 [Mariniblastus sp.]|nr:hypothetical protein [Mariniblastus sp.]
MCRMLVTSLFTLLAVANSGCMLEPLTYSEINNRRTRAYGYFPYPNENIWIQAWNERNKRWETIDHARSARRDEGVHTGFSPFPGTDSYYQWNAGLVHIPRHLFIVNEPVMIGDQWVFHLETGVMAPRDKPFCIMRAVTEGGQPLQTYYRFPDLNADTVEEWSDQGWINPWVVLYDGDE